MTTGGTEAERRRQEAERIRYLYAAGAVQWRLAKAFGLSQSQISRIANGKSRAT